MKKYNFWCGFLEAGKKSSPVAIDRNMDTGEINTVFIYNHNKKEILKYVRELVEPKLRELNAREKELEGSLKKGFKKSLETIKYKVPKAPKEPEKDNPIPKEDALPEISEVATSELDDIWDDSDD